MKKLIILFQFSILLSCNSSYKITASECEKIISELDYIGETDQKYASIPSEELVRNYGKEKAWKIFEAKRDSIGFSNQQRIKALFKKYGYLGFDQVGKENSIKFWLPIQHADNDVEFQQQMLKELAKQVKKNNAEKSNYAMLEDRVGINMNKKQRFGTQVTYNSDGQAIPKNGLIDSINIDRLRLEYGLPTFNEYYNQMTVSHFKMNKDYFLKQGITEPKLYK